MTRFKFNWDKAIEAIDFIAQKRPGITQYYVSKIMFFADREHILDFGRPITGDRYVAMEHGPVPSAILNLLKIDSGFPDEMVDLLYTRIRIETEGNKIHVYSEGNNEFVHLSGSDKEYLAGAADKYGNMSFGKLKRLSHQDPAYEAAWKKLGDANEMDVELWLNGLDNPEVAKRQLREYAICAS
jgi:uncharacterized phage-associated protein